MKQKTTNWDSADSTYAIDSFWIFTYADKTYDKAQTALGLILICIYFCWVILVPV